MCEKSQPSNQNGYIAYLTFGIIGLDIIQIFLYVVRYPLSTEGLVSLCVVYLFVKLFWFTMDIDYLNKNKMNRPSGWWFFILPVYVYLRQRRNNLPIYRFFIPSLLQILMSFIISAIMTAAYSPTVTRAATEPHSGLSNYITGFNKTCAAQSYPIKYGTSQMDSPCFMYGNTAYYTYTVYTPFTEISLNMYREGLINNLALILSSPTLGMCSASMRSYNIRQVNTINFSDGNTRDIVIYFNDVCDAITSRNIQ